MAGYVHLLPQVFKCKVCQVEVTRGGGRDLRRDYCSNACKMQTRKLVCKGCNGVFIGGNTSYCSVACRASAASTRRARALPGECVQCGGYAAKLISRRYCSNRCQALAMGARKRHQCLECQSVLFGCRSAYCSDFCRAKNSNDRYRARFKEWIRRYRQTEVYKDARRAAGARRRARLRGVYTENVSPRKVFMRDGWMCQICGIKTPSAKRGLMVPNAPELDHIVPLALGGTHTYTNTQCLCRRCNGAKGATVQGQLRLIG